MSLASAKTGKFHIGTSELRIGPLNMAGKLTDAHSVGLIDSTTLNIDQQVADLMGGFPMNVLASAVTSRSVGISATLREFSRRNLGIMMGQGLLYPGDVDSARDYRMRLLRDALPGDATYGDKFYVANHGEVTTAAEALAMWQGWIMAHSASDLGVAMASRVAAARLISRVPDVLGSELLTYADWTVPTGWAKVAADGTLKHAVGNTAVLSHGATIETATKYRLEYTIAGVTAGTVAITFGGVTSGAVSASGARDLTTTGTTALKVTPSNTFNGTIKVSLRKVTTAAASTVTSAEAADYQWAAENAGWDSDVDTFTADDAIWDLDEFGNYTPQSDKKVSGFIELRLDLGTRAAIPFYKGDIISKLAPIGISNDSRVRYFTAQLVSVDMATNRPLIRNFWKCAIGGSMSQSNSSTDFASSEMTLRVLQPTVNDYATEGSPLYHLRKIIPEFAQGMFGELSDEAMA